ncbi:MAG: DUF4292 domain-containing protein [Rubricoccaceae bacterium]|nr:DUF4292 domain-containing protein [Rubricoccaceae bacterium]
MVRIGGVLLFVVLLSGCSNTLVRNAPTAETPSAFPNHSFWQIQAELAARDSLVRTFRSDGRVHFEGPEISQGAGIGIRASLTDTLYARIRGPLAIDVGRALITADSIFAHDKLSNKYYYGRLAVVDQYVVGGSTPGLLARSLLGVIYPVADGSREVTVEADSAHYTVTLAPDVQTGISERWTIDPAIWRVVRMEEFFRDGTPYTLREFSEFDVLGEAVFPRLVQLSSLVDGLTMTVRHQNLAVNPDDISYPFEHPSDAEMIRLE